MTDFEQLLATLHAGDVRFIIVGGLAATIHGSNRLTQDLDVVYERSNDNLERLTAALKSHQPYLRGAPPHLPFEWSASTLRRGLNFKLTTCAISNCSARSLAAVVTTISCHIRSK